MGEAAEKLMSHMPDASGLDLSYREMADMQVAALNERLEEGKDKIKLVSLRARDAGIGAIGSLEDVVPLLLPHTTYKSYPESFLTEKRWDRLTKWLGTVSARPVDNVDLSNVSGIDDWVAACGRAGHHVSCSSGTTGKPAMLVASASDLEFAGRDGVAAVQWGSDIRIGDNRTVAGAVGAVASTPRNSAMRSAFLEAFVDPTARRFESGVPPVTIGSLTKMIELRRAIAEGTAKPEQITEFESESAKRQQALESAQARALDDIISKRGERLYVTGMWGSLYPFAEKVRSRGYSAKDFHPDNAVYLAGGLKRAQLPADYRRFVYETFNFQPRYTFQMYGMQEINSTMPRCQKGGRYHIPPWLVCLPVNKNGDELVPGVGTGQVEGRAAFFDLSIGGRWGGVISGDHVHVNYEACECGAKSPSIRDDIYRYADIEGDDKIGCAGTIDAYVRGMS